MHDNIEKYIINIPIKSTFKKRKKKKRQTLYGKIMHS